MRVSCCREVEANLRVIRSSASWLPDHSTTRQAEHRVRVLVTAMSVRAGAQLRNDHSQEIYSLVKTGSPSPLEGRRDPKSRCTCQIATQPCKSAYC